MYNAALLMLMIAVSGASEAYRKRECPGQRKRNGDDSKYFIQYLEQGDSCFSDLVTFEEEEYSVAELFYKKLRCELVHEAAFQSGEYDSSFNIIGVSGGSLVVGFAALSAVQEILVNDPFVYLDDRSFDVPVRVKDGIDIDQRGEFLKSKFGLSDGRIWILRELVVSLGPVFLKNADQCAIDARLNGGWSKAATRAGLNGGAFTGLSIGPDPYLLISEDSGIHATELGYRVLKELAEDYVAKY